MLLQRKGDQNSQQRRAEPQHAKPELFRLGAEASRQSGEQKNQRKFGHFGGLKLKPRQIDPAPCPIHLFPHQQNTQQQKDAQGVQRPGQPKPELNGYPAEKPERGQPDSGADRLFLEIADRALIARIVLTLGVAGGIEHYKPQHQQNQHQHQKRKIHVIALPG